MILMEFLLAPDGAVGAQAVEHGPVDVLGLGGEGRVVLQAGVGDVVVDAHGEVVLGRGLRQLVEDGLDHRRRELLAGQAVAAADDLASLPAGLGQGVDHVQVERLAGRARLLGAVEHGDGS